MQKITPTPLTSRRDYIENRSKTEHRKKVEDTVDLHRSRGWSCMSTFVNPIISFFKVHGIMSAPKVLVERSIETLINKTRGLAGKDVKALNTRDFVKKYIADGNFSSEDIDNISKFIDSELNKRNSLQPVKTRSSTFNPAFASKIFFIVSTLCNLVGSLDAKTLPPLKNILEMTQNPAPNDALNPANFMDQKETAVTVVVVVFVMIMLVLSCSACFVFCKRRHIKAIAPSIVVEYDGARDLIRYHRKKASERKNTSKLRLESFKVNNIGVSERDLTSHTRAKQMIIDSIGLRALNLKADEMNLRIQLLVDDVMDNHLNQLKRRLHRILENPPSALANNEQFQKLTTTYFSSEPNSQAARTSCHAIFSELLSRMTTMMKESRITVNTPVIDISNKFIPNIWAQDHKQQEESYMNNRKNAEVRMFVAHSDIEEHAKDNEEIAHLLQKESAITRPTYGSLDFMKGRHGGAPLYGLHYYVLKPRVKLNTSFVSGHSLFRKSDDVRHYLDMEGTLTSILMDKEHTHLAQLIINEAFYPEWHHCEIINSYGLNLKHYIETHIFHPLMIEEDIEEFHVFTDPPFEMENTPHNILNEMLVNASKPLTKGQIQNINHLKTMAKAGELPFKLYVDECEIKAENVSTKGAACDDLEGDVNVEMDEIRELLANKTLTRLSDTEKRNLSEEFIDPTTLEPCCSLLCTVFRYDVNSDAGTVNYLSKEYIASSIKSSAVLKCPVTGRILFRKKDGPCPAGVMQITLLKDGRGNLISLAGHDDCGTLKITYTLYPGIQSQTSQKAWC